MFIISLKFNKKVKKIFLLSSLAVISIAILWLNICKNSNKETIFQPDKAVSLNGITNRDRINFFHDYGWETSAEPCEIEEVLIPKKFDDVFKCYNEIQKKQHMDLNKFKGKIAKRYSYEITNYPRHKENIRGNLLVYEGQIIAVDVCSIELDGFMHGVYK